MERNVDVDELLKKWAEEYSCDIFKQEVLDSGKVVYHRKFTQLGRDFILGLFNK